MQTDPPRNLIRFERAREVAVALLDVGAYDPAVCMHSIFDLFYPENIEAWTDVIVASSLVKRRPRASLESEILEIVRMIKKLYFGSADHNRCPSWLLRGTEQCVHAILKRVLECVEGADHAVVDCAIDYLLTIVGGFSESAPGHREGMTRIHSLVLNLEANRESLLYVPRSTEYGAAQIALMSRLARDVLAEESRDVETWTFTFGHVAGSVPLTSALERAKAKDPNSKLLLDEITLAKNAPAASTSPWTDTMAILASGASMIRTDDLFYPTGRLARGGLVAAGSALPQKIAVVVEPEKKRSTASAQLCIDELPSEILMQMIEFVIHEPQTAARSSIHALRCASSSIRNLVDSCMLEVVQKTLSIAWPPPLGRDGIERARLEIFMNKNYRNQRVLLEFPIAADKKTRSAQVKILLGWFASSRNAPEKQHVSGPKSWIERRVRKVGADDERKLSRRMTADVLESVSKLGTWSGLGSELRALGQLNPSVSM